MFNNNPYGNNPPPPQDRAFGGYPGQQAHQQYNSGYPGQQAHNSGYQPQYSSGYQPQQYQASQAPPPPQQYQQQQRYGGGSYGSYQPPTGAPPPHNYHSNQAGYQPPSGGPVSYQRPGGAPPVRPPGGSQHYGPQFQGGHGQTQQPFFQYSQCTGKRKALIIGINYKGQSGELRGCINDAHNVQKFLMERYGYKAEDMVILTDDARNPRQIPTRANMIQAMQWLVAGAQPNDALFFHYSGHGGQVKDTSGDEDDGYDECVYPVDFKQAGHLLDDDMHAIMVKPLPAGARLTAIFDSCHSATCLDLPYIYSTEGKIKEPNLLAEAGSGLLGAGMNYLRGDTVGALKGIFSSGKQLMGGNTAAVKVTRETRTSPADVVMFSGCKDSQTSADTQEAGKATGAMSYAFIAALSKYPQMSYVQLLRQIREELTGRYDQKPQLSSSHPIDTSILFIC